MKKIFKSVAMLVMAVFLVSSFSVSSAFAASDSAKNCVPKKVMWGKTELKSGQLGKVTILKETKLFSLKDNKLVANKSLPAKGEFRVYSFKKVDNSDIYGVGGGQYIKKDSSIKYETPSKRKLAELKAAACVENEGGFFWKAEKNGNTVYMLGSIHLGIEEFYPLNSKIMKAFNESKYLAVEADILNLNPLEFQQTILEKAVYEDGSTIEDHISKELYKKLTDTFVSYGGDMNEIKYLKPWYLSMSLDSLKTMDPKYKSELGIDHYFLSKAGNKKVIELEGAEFQINMLSGFPEDVQIKLLEDSLKTGNANDGLSPLIKAWQTSDDAAIEKLLFSVPDNSPEYKVYMTEMFDNRNVGMANKIEKYLTGTTKGTYFVVVGAGHYFGDMSIIKLLEKKGLKIEKLQ
ncbi:TraB/GumN family protein [Cytobacillus praedii]|uniref:TraB/GumN family protein n=1 Tax=Cytobacillus praedii TaxID=1742358 RepID=A0A4R1B0C4_9BACI|nr:TraB/GumN family protein [Cytobacillus praedii]TCJ06409.1 TraB/GumN family protein [Cytobacillus praedii]